jgi:hypothetical protein
MKQIEAAKKKLIEVAKTKGIYENFGQKEVNKLKDKLNFNPYGTPKEREIADEIDKFDIWCQHFHMGLIDKLKYSK